MGVNIWTVTQATANFRDVIDKAQSLGPQTITRNGRKVALVIAISEWGRKAQRRGSLADFFASSPLRRCGLRIEPLRGRLRKVGL